MQRKVCPWSPLLFLEPSSLEECDSCGPPSKPSCRNFRNFVLSSFCHRFVSRSWQRPLIWSLSRSVEGFLVQITSKLGKCSWCTGRVQNREAERKGWKGRERTSFCCKQEDNNECPSCPSGCFSLCLCAFLTDNEIWQLSLFILLVLSLQHCSREFSFQQPDDKHLN